MLIVHLAISHLKISVREDKASGQFGKEGRIFEGNLEASNFFFIFA